MIGFHAILLQQLEESVGEGWNINTKLGGIFNEMVRSANLIPTRYYKDIYYTSK